MDGYIWDNVGVLLVVNDQLRLSNYYSMLVITIMGHFMPMRPDHATILRSQFQSMYFNHFTGDFDLPKQICLKGIF
jgi:hypothetical protein